jgi:thiosulfate/3-mercaptopyruvate sulfurtransferase
MLLRSLTYRRGSAVRVGACAAVAALVLGATLPGRAESFDTVVSPEWLSANLLRDDIIVVHASPFVREYRKSHIPNARYLWAPGLYPSNPEGSAELPTAEEATEVFRSLGVTPGSHVVLYGVGSSLIPVTRSFVAFEYYLPDVRVSILNGGLDAWSRAGFAVAVGEPPAVPPSRIAVGSKPGLIVNGDWLRARLRDSLVVILDARAREYFDGKGGGRPRPGRIPGARHLAFTDVVDSLGAFRHPDTLRALFLQAGVRPGASVVAYCHIGLQASLVHVAARVAGFRSRLYDLSFDEWSWREELPVETP